MFQKKYPIAWAYHRHSGRWQLNSQPVLDEPRPAQQFKTYSDVPIVQLPTANLPPITLAEAISNRFSCRRFTGAPLSLAALATVLKTAYGIQNRISSHQDDRLERPVPSGGGLYPLEVYCLAQNVTDIAPGIYHYAVLDHSLEQIKPGRLPKQFIALLFRNQPYVADAPAIVVLTGIIERLLGKYEDRGYRYLLIEAGHAAQNVNLAVAALELGSLNLGGFFDDDLATLLALDTEQEIPLYGIAVGAPGGTTRLELRQPPE